MTGQLQTHTYRTAAVELTALYGDRYRTYREAWSRAGRDTGLPGFPLHIDLELCHACNGQCPHCRERIVGWSGARLREADIERVMAEAASERLPSLNIGYNAEPLLEPELLSAALRGARAAGIMDIFVHTNASRLDAAARSAIIEYGVTQLCCSLDAADRDSFYRRRGLDYATVRANLESLHRERAARNSPFPLLRLSCLLSCESAGERDVFISEWRGLADSIEFQAISAIKVPASVRFTPLATTCADLWRRLAVAADGSIYPCCAFGEFQQPLRLGRVGATTLRAAWQGEQIRQLRAAHASNDLRAYPQCVACRASYYACAEQK